VDIRSNPHSKRRRRKKNRTETSLHDDDDDDDDGDGDPDPPDEASVVVVRDGVTAPLGRFGLRGGIMMRAACRSVMGRTVSG